MSVKRRRIALAVAALMPLCAHAACSASSGDPVPNPVYDASPLDVGTNPDDPETGSKVDGSTKPDASSDAPADGPTDARDGAPNVAPVAINEIYVDTELKGDGAEFVELRSTPGTPVDDLKLRLIHANGQVKYEVNVGDPGDKFDANGLWVVGGNQTFKLNVTDRVDQTISINTWGLDNDRGAVQVLRGALLLDVVGYGTIGADAAALPPPASPPTTTVEGAIATVPDPANGVAKPAHSFGRKPAAADTNNNAVDFCGMQASPGYAQKVCLP